MTIDEYYEELAKGNEVSEYDVDFETFNHIHQFDSEEPELI